MDQLLFIPCDIENMVSRFYFNVIVPVIFHYLQIFGERSRFLSADTLHILKTVVVYVFLLSFSRPRPACARNNLRNNCTRGTISSTCVFGH